MITSTTNNKIKNASKLMSSAKLRREKNLFIAEGRKMFVEACEYLSDNIEEVFISEKYAETLKGSLNEDLNKAVSEKLSTVDYEIVSDAVFKKLSDTVTPQGVITIIKCPVYNFERILKEMSGKNLKILVLEGIQDPGNLGTMVRTAEAAGIEFILADRNTVDIFNPKVIRSTMGSVYRMPVIYTDNLIDDIKSLKTQDVKVYAAHLKGQNSYKDESFYKRRAILIGNEGNGLSKEITDEADILIKIPMKGKVESLNAAVAASLLMFEE